MPKHRGVANLLTSRAILFSNQTGGLCQGTGLPQSSLFVQRAKRLGWGRDQTSCGKGRCWDTCVKSCVNITGHHVLARQTP